MEEIENNMPAVKGEKTEDSSSVSISSGDDEIKNSEGGTTDDKL